MGLYSARYHAALTLAARAHREQNRKGSDVPYIVHPVGVSVILLRHGFSEDVVVAGLLHDVVEDQDVPLSSIEAEFGPEVAAMVDVVTEKTQEGDVERPWEERKAGALDRLRRASTGAVAVKAADVVDNARALARDLRCEGASFWNNFSRGPAQRLWYFHSVAQVVRSHLGGHAIVDEVNEAIMDLEAAVAGTGSI